jgi:porphobilinogen synthase
VASSITAGASRKGVCTRQLRNSGFPSLAYQVSGECSMIIAAANNGRIDGDKAMMESLIAFKRAGADGVLTYFAPRAAEKPLKA